MKETDPTDEWINLVRKQLMGKAHLAFQEEAVEMETPYQVFKFMLGRKVATADKARRSVWLAKPFMEEEPKIILRKVLKALSMLKEKLATPEAAVQEIFGGFRHHHFAEETLMLLDSNRAEKPHQQYKLRLSSDSGRPRTSTQGGG